MYYMPKEEAHRLLVEMCGVDFGYDGDRWEEWGLSHGKIIPGPTSYSSSTSLHEWCRRSEPVEALRAKVQEGRDLEERAAPGTFTAGATPLIQAAIYDLPEHVEVLVGAGADLEATDDKGKTAATIAVEKGHVGCATILVRAGAKLSPAYQLIYHAQVGDFDQVRRMIAEGINVIVEDQVAGFTQGDALWWAARFGHTAVVRELLAAGATRVLAAHNTAKFERHKDTQRVLRPAVSRAAIELEGALGGVAVTHAASVEELKRRHPGIEARLLDYLEHALEADRRRVVKFLRGTNPVLRAVAFEQFGELGCLDPIPDKWLAMLDEYAARSDADAVDVQAAKRMRQELDDRAREEEMDILTKLGLREDGTPL